MKYKRREFIRATSLTSVGLAMSGILKPLSAQTSIPKGKRVGIIGLDTSHSTAFTKTLNTTTSDEYSGYKVVAAYPYGSKDIKSSYERIPGYIEEVKKYGVEIVESIKELISKVDVVLLETNDGRLHLEQALPVLKAGKRMFIDKPIAASLSDAKKIFEVSEKYKTPLFSASSLRYIEGISELSAGKTGKVIGADTYSPAMIELTHPDLFWYGIHGVEMLFAIMGTGCKSVTRAYTESTDIVTGIWADGRIGTFRGIREGKKDFGGTVHTEKSVIKLGKFSGYNPLLKDIIRFFETGETPVKSEETLEIFAFMHAADESKKKGGIPIDMVGLLKK